MTRVRVNRSRNIAIAIFLALVTVAIVALFVFLLAGKPIPVLETHGTIADQERTIIIITALLAAIVVVPVFAMLAIFAWRYRAGNSRAKYQPNMSGHRGLELLWWGIPCLIILVLGIITYVSTHNLDPYKQLPLAKGQTPVKVQVVALQWRWLFIYPGTQTASMNDLTIPVNTPIELSITADAPMNSFWIPALAGQVYAMSGMSTKLNLSADSVGTYNGVSSNISGSGFAAMSFKVHVVNSADYKSWVQQGAHSMSMLTYSDYEDIAKPSNDSTPRIYMLMDDNLFNDIINSYTSASPNQNGSMEMGN